MIRKSSVDKAPQFANAFDPIVFNVFGKSTDDNATQFSNVLPSITLSGPKISTDDKAPHFSNAPPPNVATFAGNVADFKASQPKNARFLIVRNDSGSSIRSNPQYANAFSSTTSTPSGTLYVAPRFFAGQR